MSSIYNPEYKIAMNCLKQIRKENNITQKELASRLQCTQGYISKYEQGQVKLDIIDVKHICEILGVSLFYYVTFLEENLSKNKV